MHFDWNDYIKLAEELALTQNQAKLRSAVSRAYYGVFSQCRTFCKKSMDKSPDVHRKIIEKLKMGETREEISLGNSLSNLRDKRNEADYNSFAAFTPQDTISNINEAKRAISILNFLRGENN